jgi:hypothetical protein
VISQIFSININFGGGPNIKPSQIYFLILIAYAYKNLFNIKLPKIIIGYAIASFSLIITITFFSLYSYDLQHFFHYPTNIGFDPFIHIILLAFNIFTPIFVYCLMKTYSVSSSILKVFHDSVFYVSSLFMFVIISPIDSSFLYKQSTEILLNNEVVVQRFIGGVEYSVLCVAAIISILNSTDIKLKIPYSLFKIMVLLIGVGIGFSRQAILSLLIGIFLTFIISNSRNIKKSLILFFASVFLIFLISYSTVSIFFPEYFLVFSERVLSIFQLVSYSTGTIGDRFQLWFKMINENSNNIFFGQGMDSYIKFFSFRGEGAHNFPLMVYHSGGIFAFLSYIYIQFGILVSLLEFVRKSNTAKSLFIIMTIFLISSLTGLIYMSHIFWIFIGIAYYYLHKLQT